MEMKKDLGWKIGIITFFVLLILAPFVYFLAPSPWGGADEKDFSIAVNRGIDFVTYVDTRAPGVVEVYSDFESDGHFDKYTYYCGFHSVFAHIDGEVEKEEKIVSNRKNKDGDSVTEEYETLPIESWKAEALQKRYEAVKAAYQVLPERDDKLSPHGYPENETKLRPEKIRAFLNLFREYRIQGERAYLAKTKRQNEVGQLKTYIAFSYTREAYYRLNWLERKQLFSKPNNLPRGINIDGVEMISFLGMNLTSKYPRVDLECFLQLSYMETDYMLSWDIYNEGEYEKLSNKYEAELSRKGLI